MSKEFEEKRKRIVTAERAKLAAQRLINSHFKNSGEHARMSIPVNVDDDDIVIHDFIELAESSTQQAPEPRTSEINVITNVVIESLQEDIAKLREAISPGRLNRSNDYYCAVARKMRERETRIVPAAQEEMARLRGRVKMAEYALDKQVIVINLRDQELKAAIAAHLAEQAKAQEAHQNELAALQAQIACLKLEITTENKYRQEAESAVESAKEDTEWLDGQNKIAHEAWHKWAEIAKAAEQTSLASQAKLIRKCAEIAGDGTYCYRGKCSCQERSDVVLNLLTTAMIETEKAVLAAEQERKLEIK